MSNDNEIDRSARPLHEYVHRCRYWPVKRSLQATAHGKKWVERCKCMRNVIIDSKYFVEGSNFPQITKYWYSVDGDLERITGYQGK